MFNDESEASRVNGLPEKALKTPFTCQPPRIVLPRPVVAHFFSLPNGSSYTKASSKLCGISWSANARLRENTLGAFHKKPVQSAYAAWSMAFDQV